VREGFLRYFRDGKQQALSLTLTPHQGDAGASHLPESDDQIVALARKRALAEQAERGTLDDFVVGTEAGLLSHLCGDEVRHFVRSWTVILGLDDEAWGSSGSIQLPSRLLAGLDSEDIHLAIPGTLRGGGMVSSLSGGQETRQSATALATFHALCSLMYGTSERRPGGPR
jgi:non-canonical (house-cleaning) NTP pyrophosphatase